ncbi:MAG: PEP-CTERM sorting domain-containing protein [Desulfobacterales bacterium]|nr:PEP-CTERM sorting domain-containing protein [Desulfobacterales bacterium]
MSKKFKFILLTISFFVLSIQIQPVSALPIDVNDSFDGPVLRSDLWTERFVPSLTKANIHPGQFASNDYMHVSANSPGSYILESNFYFTDDFNITIDLYVDSTDHGGVRFYKYGEEHKTVHGDHDLGTFGDTWGFAGDPLAGFFEGSTPVWSVRPTGYETYLARYQWHQLRIARTGSQITTYHRAGKDNSNPWVRENTFFNFSGSIYIDIASSEDSGNADSMSVRWDNFTSDVLASTDPSGFSAVPEPATMALFGFGLLGLAGIGRRKTRTI